MNVIRDEYPPSKQTYATGAAAVASTAIIPVASVPDGFEIVIGSIIIQNTTTNPTTITLKAGNSTFLQVLAQNQGDGIAIIYPRKMEPRLGNGNALLLNLSGNNSHNYNIGWWLEPTRNL